MHYLRIVIEMFMGEDAQFAGYLLVGLVVIGILFFVGISGFSSGPSGAFISNIAERSEIVEDKIISSSPTKLVDTQAVLKAGFGKEDEGVTVPFFVSRPSTYNAGVLELTVLDRENGPIAFFLNDNEIFKGSPAKGYHWVEFDKDFLQKGNVLDGKALGGLNPFETTVYKVKIVLSGANVKKFNTSFSETPEKYKKAILQVFWKSNYGKIIIKVNDQLVYNDEPKNNLNIRLDNVKKKNTIEFLPEPGSRNWIDFAQVVFEK